MRFKPDEICNQYKVSELASRYGVKLEKSGQEHKACCPFHHEDTPSFTISDHKQFYHCFGCGAHGNVINFVMKIDNKTFVEACQIITGEKPVPETVEYFKDPARKEDPYARFVPIKIPDGTPEIEPDKWIQAFNPKKDKFQKLKATKVWRYKKTNGYVLRLEYEKDGKPKKITPTLRWCLDKETEKEGWVYYAFDRPRPLYGVEFLENEDLKNLPVMIVEGEKCVEAARLLFSESYIIISWSGGGKNARHAKWDLIKDREILIWPDMDAEGYKSAFEIAAILYESNKHIDFIKMDDTKPKGWDVADAVDVDGWDEQACWNWALPRVKEYSPDMVDDVRDSTLPEPTRSQSVVEAVEHREEPATDELPFKILGYNNGLFYYYPRKSGQIVALSAAGHSELNLYQLAPERYWEASFGHKSGRLYKSASASLMEAAQNKGVFSESSKMRGSGAWLDDGRIVLHCGSNLFIDGKKTDPYDIESEYIYEKSHKLLEPAAEELTDKETREFFDLCKMLSWENKLSATLFAGWCVIAPVCAMLDWRPHIQITGAAEAGKSTISDDILEKLLSSFALMTQGGVTESAIRRLLRNDARPVIIDEAENQGKIKQEMAKILQFARVSSSGGMIPKTSMEKKGQVDIFTARSCFCFLGINSPLKDFADKTRFSQLHLIVNRADDAQEQFEEIEKIIERLLTKEYARKLFTRTANNLPLLLKNIETFKKAAQTVLRSGRASKQIGTMLAGAQLLHNTNEITFEEAKKWIKGQEWGGYTAIDDKKDEEKCLHQIFSRRVTVQNSTGVRFDIDILQAIRRAGGEAEDLNLDAGPCIEVLARYGIKVDDADKKARKFYIANTCISMAELLSDTVWSNDWGAKLKDLERAETTKNMYFRPDIKSRATALPYDLVLKKDDQMRFA